VVYWSVCLTSEPCKNCWTDRDAIWVDDSDGPREPCIRWGPDPLWEGAILRGEKGCPIVKYRDTVVICAKAQMHVVLGCGLGWAEFNHICQVVLVCLTTLCRKLCKHGQTNRFAIWVVDSGEHKFNRICQVSPMCPHGFMRSSYKDLYRLIYSSQQVSSHWWHQYTGVSMCWRCRCLLLVSCCNLHSRLLKECRTCPALISSTVIWQLATACMHQFGTVAYGGLGFSYCIIYRDCLHAIAFLYLLRSLTPLKFLFCYFFR